MRFWFLLFTHSSFLFFYRLAGIEYVARYATKDAADAATDESSSDDDMSSVASFSDDDDAPGLEL